jgi:dihydroorotate dehydrogenase
LEFIHAGATLVAVGTENFRNPRVGHQIASEIAAALQTSRSSAPIGNAA